MSETPPQILVTAAALSDVGRVRSNNEDAFASLEIATGARLAEEEPRRTGVGARGALLAVSDGMGGARAGEIASSLALATLEESLATDEASPEEALRSAVERANAAVFEAGKREPELQGMGATMTAVLLHGSDAYIAAVGDSRAYLLRSGRFRQMTRDQSYVQVLVDAGILKPEEADASPMKNVILQSMGQKPEVQVALGRLELRRGDRLLLCSDGLTGHVKDEEIASLLRTNAPVDSVARSLVDLALDRGGEDNVTVLVADIDGTLPLRPIPETVTQTFQVIAEFQPPMGPARKNTSLRPAEAVETAPTPEPPAPRPRRFALVPVAVTVVALLLVGAWIFVRS